MKKIIYYLLCLILLPLLNSCIKWDNYDLPKETLHGIIIDKNTGDSLNTEIGANGIRIKMMELSWTASTVTPWYFYAMQDGSFNNTKVFAGNYNIEPQGAFVPLVQTDAVGNITKDSSKTVDIKGIANVKFYVEPFLKIAWVGQPVVDTSLKRITVQFLVTRGTTDPLFQQALTDVWLFINSSSYFVGNNNYDARYSTRKTGAAAVACLNVVTSIITTGVIPRHNTYYIRIGARTSYLSQAVARYNYTKPIAVIVP